MFRFEKRYAISIDIEGFSNLAGTDQLNCSLPPMPQLFSLMKAIYSIGSNYNKYTNNRFFAHQIVDGFLLVSEYDEEILNVPISIAILLMRSVLLSGGVAKACISTGDFSDISGCYPHPLNNSNGNNIEMGNAIMTLLPVMGTALINASGVAKKSPSGSLLLLPEEFLQSLPQEIKYTHLADCKLISIDWIHSEISDKFREQYASELPSETTPNMECMIYNYIRKNSLTTTWKNNTIVLLNLAS